MKKMNKKITIIGAGFVGSSIAFSIVVRNLANEIVLVDLDEIKAKAETLDIVCGLPRFSNTKVRTGSVSDIKDSHIVIICAGRGRLPNESRLDLIHDNFRITKTIAEKINLVSTNAIFIIVSNPVDLITAMYFDCLHIPSERIFGTGCSLDCSRLLAVLSTYLGTSSERINLRIVGEHGDNSIILWDKITVNDLNLESYCLTNNIQWNETIQNDIECQVKQMGAEIISGKGKTQFGISYCVCEIVSSIFGKNPAEWCLSLIDKTKDKTIAYSVPCSFVNGRIVKKDLYLTLQQANKLESTKRSFLGYRKKGC